MHDARTARSSQRGVAHTHSNVHGTEQTSTTADAGYGTGDGEDQSRDSLLTPIRLKNRRTDSARGTFKSYPRFRSVFETHWSYEQFFTRDQSFERRREASKAATKEAPGFDGILVRSHGELAA